MTALTVQQERLWRFIRNSERCPTFDEMQAHLGLRSKSNIHRLLGVLETKGYVSRVGSCSGGYRMARSLIAHETPNPELPPLALYPLNDLLDEVGRRLPQRQAA